MESRNDILPQRHCEATQGRILDCFTIKTLFMPFLLQSEQV
ncbi:hypothetical protein [Helicobacter rodentium]|nr:hypothetical protein [Helicobacter rodentium]